MKLPTHSALVDLVIPEASDEERADATQHWFALLSVLVRIVDKEERKRHDSRESDADARVQTVSTSV